MMNTPRTRQQHSGMAADATMGVVGQAVAVTGTMVGKEASRSTSLMTGDQQHSQHAHRVKADRHLQRPASCVLTADLVQVNAQWFAVLVRLLPACARACQTILVLEA